jgi:hypothetical protein
MFANSLLILFSSSSLALAFLRSAINWTKPRMFALFPEDPRLRKPAAAEEAISQSRVAFYTPGTRTHIHTPPRSSNSLPPSPCSNQQPEDVM